MAQKRQQRTAYNQNKKQMLGPSEIAACVLPDGHAEVNSYHLYDPLLSTRKP